MSQPPKKQDTPQDTPEAQLTQEELREVREIIEADKRAKWLWASIRSWAVWVAAVAGGATVFWESAKRMLKSMVGE